MNLMNLELLFENIRGGCFCAFNEFCKTNNLEIILIKAFTTNETAPTIFKKYRLTACFQRKLRKYKYFRTTEILHLS